MDSNTKLYLERAENELRLAEMIMQLSINQDIQTKIPEINKTDTYFSSVISHAYYSIFYTAKAYLIIKGIITKIPNEHKKTYNQFKKFVSQGIVDKELLILYENVLIKAETLLGIFKIEKKSAIEIGKSIPSKRAPIPKGPLVPVGVSINPKKFPFPKKDSPSSEKV